MGMRWFQRLMNWVGASRGTPDLGGRPAAKPGQPREHQEQAMRDTGSANVQIGQAGGSVRVVHLNQQRHVTQVVHQHFYPTAATPAQPAEARPPAANDGNKLTPEQREVLALMRSLEKSARIRVLEFMRREFSTSMVSDLLPPQVYRVKRYVETVSGRKRSAQRPMTTGRA